MRVLFLMLEPHQEPLGAGYLISAAKRAGHNAEGRFFSTQKDAVSITRDFRPDIVAFSVITGSQSFYADIALALKKQFNVFTVFGGPHPSYSPDFISHPGVDSICRGEGELAFVEFINAFASLKDFHSIPNFVFSVGENIISNPLAPLVEDLDSLPFPDREFFYADDTLRRSHLKSFIASRGCPYSCTYCFNHVHNEMYRGLGSTIRRRSADNVIGEILDTRSRYPLDMVQFMDDTFILSRTWLEEFTEKFASRVGIDFFCNARSELIDRRIVRDLVRGGCKSICLGIETGDIALRREMLGRNQDDEVTMAACRLLRASGIRVMTTNMLGIPGGNLESDIATLKLNAKCRVDYAWTSLTYPYPGTRIHELASAKGIHVPEADSLTQSYFNEMPFDSPDKIEIENLHRLLAVSVSLRLPENTLRALIRARSKPARIFYTLIFGFWKLYCYEMKIFKRRDAFFLLNNDFYAKLIQNVTLGFRMMFGNARGRRAVK